MGRLILTVLSLIGAVILHPAPPTGRVEGFIGHRQHYSLSCEMRSATDVARYWGLPVREEDLIAIMPRSDDPNAGFVGRLTAPVGSLPPEGYGVYAPSVAYVLRHLGLHAEAHVDYTLAELREEIASGHPVIIWGTYRMRDNPIQRWPTLKGSVPVVSGEHTYVAVGYDEKGIFLVDAYDGRTHYFETEDFLRGWSLLGWMAVTVDGHRTQGYPLLIVEREGYPHLVTLDGLDRGPW